MGIVTKSPSWLCQSLIYICFTASLSNLCWLHTSNIWLERPIRDLSWCYSTTLLCSAQSRLSTELLRITWIVITYTNHSRKLVFGRLRFLAAFSFTRANSSSSAFSSSVLPSLALLRSSAWIDFQSASMLLSSNSSLYLQEDTSKSASMLLSSD